MMKRILHHAHTQPNLQVFWDKSDKSDYEIYTLILRYLYAPIFQIIKKKRKGKNVVMYMKLCEIQKEMKNGFYSKECKYFVQTQADQGKISHWLYAFLPWY